MGQLAPESNLRAELLEQNRSACLPVERDNDIDPHPLEVNMVRVLIRPESLHRNGALLVDSRFSVCALAPPEGLVFDLNFAFYRRGLGQSHVISRERD